MCIFDNVTDIIADVWHPHHTTQNTERINNRNNRKRNTLHHGAVDYPSTIGPTPILEINRCILSPIIISRYNIFS